MISNSAPPGYRLTEAARERLELLQRAPNRHERRVLDARFRKQPIRTFEPIPKAPNG